MERSLTMGALALGVLGWICGLLAARARPGAPARARTLSPVLWIAGAVLPALFWLLTLPDAPPFGVGHAAGNGVLLGGLAALLGTWALIQFVPGDDADARAAGTASLLALAGAAAIAAPFFFRPWRLDALLGVALGWLTTSCVFYVGAAVSQSPARPLSLALAKATGYSVGACASLGIGVIRDAMMPGAQGATWSTLMAVLTAAVPFVILLAALPAALAARRVPFPNLFNAPEEEQNVAATRGWQMMLAGVLFLIVAQLLAVKVADKPVLLFCAALGVVAGAIAWRVVADAQKQRNVPVLAPLVLLAAFIVSYRLMQGFGGGVMLLGAWLAGAIAGSEGGEVVRSWGSERDSEVASSPHDLTTSPPHHLTTSPPSHLTTLLFFGAAAMLYRLAATRFRYEIDTLELDEHFAFFGLLVGAALPSFLARLATPRRPNAPSEVLLRLFLCGAILMAAPLLTVMLWGAKAALVLTTGAALGLLLSPAEIALPHAAGFFALGGALAVAEWMKRALPLYEIARGDKARVLGIVVGALVVLLLVVDVISRRRKLRAVKEPL